MKRILIPVDFSDNSIKAVMYAVTIASKTGAVLRLLNVIEPPPLSYSDLPLPDPALTETLISENYGRLEKLKKDLLKQDRRLEIYYHVLEGEVRSTITDFAKEQGCDLIVMGTHGASGFKGFIWSSLTAKTLMQSAVPVVAVPGEYQLTEPQKILLATNRFEEEAKLTDPVFRFAETFNAAVHVVVFVDKDTAHGYDYLESGKHLDRYQSFLHKKYPHAVINSELIDGSDFENALALYESREEIDLIAMITYPKNFFDRLTGKTITKNLSMHSRIPVLAIPASLAVAVNRATV